MPEEKSLTETAEALGLGSLIPAVYRDLISPAARELGEGLATIAKAVKISLAPVEATVWGYERMREWLGIRVTSILAERRAQKIQSPPLSVAGPLIMQMVFAAEEPYLREMYAKLLATSMDLKTVHNAHPSFVPLIQQMAPDEARILSHLASLNSKWPSWHGDQETNELKSAMHKMCAEAGVHVAMNAEIYVENLIRLRILRHVTSSDVEYHEGGHARFGEYGPSISAKHIEFIELTAYGKALLRACVIEGPSPLEDE